MRWIHLALFQPDFQHLTCLSLALLLAMAISVFFVNTSTLRPILGPIAFQVISPHVFITVFRTSVRSFCHRLVGHRKRQYFTQRLLHNWTRLTFILLETEISKYCKAVRFCFQLSLKRNRRHLWIELNRLLFAYLPRPVIFFVHFLPLFIINLSFEFVSFFVRKRQTLLDDKTLNILFGQFGRSDQEHPRAFQAQMNHWHEQVNVSMCMGGGRDLWPLDEEILFVCIE